MYKGGEWKEFSEEELARSIRSVIGRGTFPDRLMRFADMADEFVEENSFRRENNPAVRRGG